MNGSFREKSSASVKLLMAAAMTAALALPQAGQAEQPAQTESLIDPGQIVGGSTKQMTADVHPTAGFLPRPDLLVAGGQGQPVLQYRAPGATWTKYRRVILDAVQVKAGPDSQLNTVSPQYRTAVANYFYSILYNGLKTHCVMSNRVTPDAIRLKFALIDTKTPQTTINTVATYAPYASTAYSVASLLFNKGVGYFAGTATAEAFAVDAGNGALLWEAVDKRGGTTAFIANTTDNWRDVRHIFETWTEQMAMRLKQNGICR
ncbi:MAG TPA: DUF3313 domain-containing protein [Stellaceae bacterium]|nr:DUF3313 domain-containing protein [Stellaceae bacterium]